MLLVVKLNDIPNLREYIFDKVSNDFDNSLIKFNWCIFNFVSIAIAFLCTNYYDVANLHYMNTMDEPHQIEKIETENGDVIRRNIVFNDRFPVQWKYESYL